MLLLRAGSRPGRRKEIPAMNSYAILLVDERIEQLRRDAAERRADPSTGWAMVRRIGAALGAIVAAITAPVTSSRSATPALDGYPYRG
jgi:hypothetical protein